jgi:4-amino-4-deoxy-L-arabinose transferase-like glycosyltransferase
MDGAASSPYLNLGELPPPRMPSWLAASTAILFCVLLTVFGAIALGSGSLHPDMTEAWAWGKEFQLGYAKHPPFAAWIAGSWFYFMPKADWSFYLLASINVTVGLAGVWRLAGLFMGPRGRWAAVLLLVLTPSFTLWALKFNANAPLLSTWPWATYFFVQSLLTRRLGAGAFAGAICGMAMLTKYSSVVLFASMFLAALSHPDLSRYFRSPAPYVIALTCLAVLGPHIWWMVSAGFPTIGYAVSKTAYPAALAFSQTITSVVGSLGALGLAAGACAVAFGSRIWPMLKTLWANLSDRSWMWLAILAYAPFFLTIAGVFANLRVSSGFLIPVFFATPVAFLVLSRARPTTTEVGRLASCVAAVWLPLLLASPLLGYYAPTNATAGEPTKQIAVAATKVWRTAFGRPLRYVAGTPALATAATFYSSDAPSLLLHEDPSASPWVTSAQVAEHGLLIVCRAIDLNCIAKAGSAAGPDALRYWDKFEGNGRQGAVAPRMFLFTLLPPANAEILLD